MPRSSASPTVNAGQADRINQVNSSAFKSKTKAKGIKPKVSRGISPNKLTNIAKPPTLGTNPL